MDERVCPKCHYPCIAQDWQGWFCLNGGCGRFDKPEYNNEIVSNE